MPSRLEEARRYLATTAIAGIVLDYGLPDGTGADLLAELSTRAECPGVVLASAHPRAIEVAKHYGVAFVRKPFELDVLLAAVRVLLEGKSRPMPSPRDAPIVPISPNRNDRK